MCGIAGIINGGSPETLERMATVQAHRGPDDWGSKWFAERRTGLAHRRLSILDLSSAKISDRLAGARSTDLFVELQHSFSSRAVAIVAGGRGKIL